MEAGLLSSFKQASPFQRPKEATKEKKQKREQQEEEEEEDEERRRGEAMKGRGIGGGGSVGGVPTDLLVCFPSRAHLTLMPKPICSPSRPTEAGKRHHHRATAAASRGQASPLFKAKFKHMDSEIAEPTSPKVTCSGQIKVKHKPRARKLDSRDENWLTIVDEIDRQHKGKKRPNWLEALGLKKDIIHFLNALRGLRFNMRCFGSFHGAVDCSTDEDDDAEDAEEEEEGKEGESSAPRTIFSKWFMVLEENQGHGVLNNEVEEEAEEEDEEEEVVAPHSSVPPSNALMLMRCRSAPAKGWLDGEEGGGQEVTARKIIEEEREKERLVLMSYAPDFFKVSTDIAKEAWVAGSMDPLARSRSWRR